MNTQEGTRKRKLVCLRGHDTSYPESRLSDGGCRRCKNITNAKYALTKAGKENKVIRQKKYRSTAKGKYADYKQGLRKRIRRQYKRLIELETQLKLLDERIANAEEIRH